MFWLFAVALWAAMLVLPVVLLVALLPAGRDCPRCGSETLPIRFLWLQPVRRLVSRRWCIGCGWEGISRRTRWPRPVGRLVAAVPDKRDGADDDVIWKGGV